MPRPKGSRNKRDMLAAVRSFTDKDDLTKLLDKSEQECQAERERLMAILRKTRKELRAIDRRLEEIRIDKGRIDELVEMNARKEDIENAVGMLVRSGRTADDILAIFK